MRVVLSNITRCLLILSFVACGAALAVQGQNRQVNVISARAGGVNHVSGDVTVGGEGRAAGQVLTTTDNLAVGDTVRTGAGAQVEVLLNPGSYIRVGENSEFALADDSLESLRIKLTKGSAVVEATGFDDLRVSIEIVTPQTMASIIKSGIYRFNVTASGLTEVAVRKGRALVGRERTVVRGGKIARVGAGGLEVAKFDKKNSDSLDLWSRERGKMLAEANRKLSVRQVNKLLASAQWDNILSTQRDGFGYVNDLNNRGLSVAGIWYFDPGRRCYTFIPGNYGWTSPYGYGYGNNLFWGGGDPRNQCVNCGLNNSQVIVGNNGSTGINTGGGSSNNGGGNRNGGTPNPSPVVRPEPAAPREFVRPSFDQPRSVERAQPATPTRDQ
ncbi:MAG TPA: FecR family protein [Pyrinomonadaceae bacterium]|jgi:hypothetical protein|nr:FecR family protein [Pyrinomonadaceae bacterium]